MEWWDRLRRVWIGVVAKLGIRKTGKHGRLLSLMAFRSNTSGGSSERGAGMLGLGKLRQEVRTCEYEDVHVMWEILRKTDTELGWQYPLTPAADSEVEEEEGRRGHRRRTSGSHVWAVFEWASRGAPYNLCRSF